jgi:hypothetical protein
MIAASLDVAPKANLVVELPLEWISRVKTSSGIRYRNNGRIIT